MNLDGLWYGLHPARWLLWPLSLIFALAARARRAAYRLGWLGSERLPVPVIVVGNITVGGTGKTPLVIWIVEKLRAQGWRPGVVSRGYGGHSKEWPRAVDASSNPDEVGDEPVLLARRLGCPVVVDPKRLRAARSLLAGHDVNVIVSDDGLQHYALQRDVEVAVVDGMRGLGNRMMLPAGPLREPPERLKTVDLVVTNGANGEGIRMDLVPDAVVSLYDDETRPLSSFAGVTVHAVAGVGNPERFFATLRAAGLVVLPKTFPDHHSYTANDLDFADNSEVVMTEKDAVKCRDIVGPKYWYLRVQPRFEAAASARFADLLQALRTTQKQDA